MEFRVPVIGADGRMGRESNIARIHVPKGVSDGARSGQKLCLAGKGLPRRSDGAGD